MPLKIVARKDSPYLYLRGSVRGKTIFESTGTPEIELAEVCRIKREQELWSAYLYGPTYTFADVVVSYLEFEKRSASTKAYVAKLFDHFEHTPPNDIDQAAADAACRKILGKDAKASTKVRAIYAPLSALLRHGAIRKMCAMPAFEKPRVKAARTVFLLPAQVNALIENAAPHVRPLLTFLAGTGARMSEALELQWADVDLRGARAVVLQKQGDYRYIDLCPRLVAMLSTTPPDERAGAVFRTHQVTNKHGKVVRKAVAYNKTRIRSGQIKTSWAAACYKAGLPGKMQEWKSKKSGRIMRRFLSDITPHGLRHTWASAHYAMHHDLLKLKHDGGWSTVAMVERYTHLMPAVYGPEWAAWLNASQ